MSYNFYHEQQQKSLQRGAFLRRDEKLKIQDLILENTVEETQRIEELNEEVIRREAMAVLLTWIDGTDYTYDSLGVLVGQISEEEEEISPEEQDYFNQISQILPEAVNYLGGNAEEMIRFLNKEEDQLGARIGAFLYKKYQEQPKKDADLINAFAIKEKLLLESIHFQNMENQIQILEALLEERAVLDQPELYDESTEKYALIGTTDAKMGIREAKKVEIKAHRKKQLTPQQRQSLKKNAKRCKGKTMKTSTLRILQQSLKRAKR